MAFPQDLLSAGEEVVARRHPHAKMLVWPVIALLVVLAGGIWLAVSARDLADPWGTVALIAIGVVGLVLLGWLFVAPFLRWRGTHFVVTTERLIAREGVIKRTGIDIPMSRINSVQFRHGLLDRVFGCGTLIVESASEEPITFDDIPKVEQVHTLIYREMNNNLHDDFLTQQE